jgi:hypothetical protein
MAIQFLNNLDINDNQLLNAKVQVASTAPTEAKGQIYLDSTTDVNTLKYYDGNGWVGLKQLNISNGTFINLSNLNPVGTNVISLRAELSATGTPSDTVYLRGDNTWSPISTIPGTYTWSIQGGTGGPTTVASGTNITFAGGTNVTTTLVGNTLTIDAANPDQTVTLTGDVTGTGTTSIATTISAGAVDFAMLNPADVITAAEGIGNNNNDVTIPTSAAVKAYADSLIVGGLIYQGGYNADTNIPDLTTSPNSILKGWTYTVTEDGTFFGEQLRVGDVLIAEISSPTTLADWTTVQNNIDLASLTQIGIGNVVPSTAASLEGLSVTYLDGTATAGLNLSGLITQSPANNALAFIPFYDQQAGVNLKVGLSTLAGDINELTSKAFTISDTATISHGFITRDVVVQLYDIDTYETVYADVIRTTTNTVTITFASQPTNDVRVLVQKIG